MPVRQIGEFVTVVPVYGATHPTSVDWWIQFHSPAVSTIVGDLDLGLSPDPAPALDLALIL